MPPDPTLPQPPFEANVAAGQELTEAEWNAYAAWWGRRTAQLEPGLSGWVLVVVGGGLALLGAFVADQLEVVRQARGSDGVIAMLMFVAFHIGVWIIHGLQRRHALRRSKARRADPLLQGPQRYVLDEDGVSMESASGRAWTPWTVIPEAHVEADVLMLRLGRMYHARAIPLRAFASPAHAAAAAAFARAKAALPAGGRGG